MAVMCNFSKSVEIFRENGLQSYFVLNVLNSRNFCGKEKRHTTGCGGIMDNLLPLNFFSSNQLSSNSFSK